MNLSVGYGIFSWSYMICVAIEMNEFQLFLFAWMPIIIKNKTTPREKNYSPELSSQTVLKYFSL